MENLMLSGLAGLQNEDISERIRSAQLLRDNLASDFLVDVGTLVDSLIKNLSESNQTLVLLCIDCLEAVISSYQSEILLKYDIDRLFETLLANFSDSKAQIRNRSCDLMVAVVNVLGIVAGADRLTRHLTHQNFRVREQVLFTITKLVDVYGSDFVIPQLAARVAPLLSDSLNSVRQLALSVLLTLHKALGDGVLDEVGVAGIDPQHLSCLFEALQKTNRKAPVASTESHSSASLVAVGNTPASATTSFVFDMALFSALLDEGESIQPLCIYTEKELALTMENIASSLQSTEEWQNRIKSLQKLEGLCVGGSVQGVFENVFVHHLRNMWESICQQISDLRSTVSKEACRCVATVAVTLGQGFFTYSFGEQALMRLLKQSSLKIAVMSSAADRCARIIVSSTRIGSSKFLLYLAENSSCKSAQQRRLILELISIAFALWRCDVLQKSFSAVLKLGLMAGLTDADSSTRKAARLLLWCIYERDNGVFAHLLDSQCLGDLEESVLKVIHSEKVRPSDDFLVLMKLLHSPTTVQEVRSNYLVVNAAPNAFTEEVAEMNRQPTSRAGILGNVDAVETVEQNSTHRTSRNVLSDPLRVRDKLPVPLESDDVDMFAGLNDSPGCATIPSRPSLGSARRIAKTNAVAVQDIVKIIAPCAKRGVTCSLSQQQPKEISSPKQIVRGEKITADSVIIPPKFVTTEQLSAMLGDTVWNERLSGVEFIHGQLYQETLDSTLRPAEIEVYIDLLVAHTGDIHTKVAVGCLQALKFCVEHFSVRVQSRLADVCLPLFHRLTDRRSAVQVLAEQLLNCIRESISPPILFQCLSPRIGETPERLKVGLLQYIGAIIPHCADIFEQHQPCGLFLARLAHLGVGSGSVKPSVAVVQAVTKVLELVHKAAPEVVVNQLVLLPLQQQLLLRKMLEAKVSDIDLQVASAARTEWNNRMSSNNSAQLKSRAKSPDENIRPHSAPVQSMSTEIIDVVQLLSSLQFTEPVCRVTLKRGADDVMKIAMDPQQAKFWDSHASQVVSVLLESIVQCGSSMRLRIRKQSEPSELDSSPILCKSNGVDECLHLYLNLLLVVSRNKGCHMKNVLELVVLKLLSVCCIFPQSAMLTSEAALMELSCVDPSRFIHLVVPFISNSTDADGSAATERGRLVALRVVRACMSHLSTSAALGAQQLLPSVVAAVLPQLSSATIDIRQAAVMVLVEAYALVGDALHPLLRDLTPAQLKLLTIYINKRELQS